MKIAVIAAMAEEFRAVARCLPLHKNIQFAGFKAANGQDGEHEIMLLESGMGFKNAAMAAEALVSGFGPDLLVSAGFCGGVTPELLAGDVVVAKEILIAGEGGLEEIPVLLAGAGQTFVARQSAVGKRVVAGVFVSTPAIVAKSRLGEMVENRYANVIVEMECGALAIVAAENKIPLLAIRAVSDVAAEELGFTLEEFCDMDLRHILIGKVLLAIVRKPGIVPQLLRLRRSSKMAADNLMVVLPGLFAVLKDAGSR